MVEDGRHVTRQRCIHCGRVGWHLDSLAGASGSVSGGGGGDGCRRRGAHEVPRTVGKAGPGTSSIIVGGAWCWAPVAQAARRRSRAASARRWWRLRAGPLGSSGCTGAVAAGTAAGCAGGPRLVAPRCRGGGRGSRGEVGGRFRDRGRRGRGGAMRGRARTPRSRGRGAARGRGGPCSAGACSWP